MATPTPLRPLFRWAGGKRWLVPRILDLLPKTFGRYYEPFVGGGALFFALRPTRARLGDKNHELINAYECIRDDPELVGRLLRAMRQDVANYYRVRGQRPRVRFRRAARTIYLTTLAFNGIYRVNRNGQFNVPFGGRDYPELGSAEVLRTYAQALAGAELVAGDFDATLGDAVAGDLIYLDPPYTVTHSNNGFVKYNARIFLPKDQESLAETARDLAKRGCHVIVSNAFHDSIKNFYEGFHPVEVRRRSVMAASADYRNEVAEYLFTTPLEGGN